MDEAAGVNDFGPLRVRSIVRHLQQLLIEGERLRSFFGHLPLAAYANHGGSESTR
jgi:hypothetical protein